MTPAVVADRLEVRYGSGVALAESSFSIPAAAITAVVGPNGSGKSTVLNAIAGLVEPARGSIQVASPRRRISYVLQSAKVNDALPVTVREVVTMGRYASVGLYRWLRATDRRLVAEVMERLRITDLASRHLTELSGGQRQRVFIAQGLVQTHDILLLDEPMTGLDLPSAQIIDEVIHDEPGRGCTVILTTHDLGEAAAADNVLLLGGRVVAFGPPDSVLTPENLAAAYGPGLLHTDAGVVIDDPAHLPVPGRHVHRERIIHVEVSHPEDK